MQYHGLRGPRFWQLDSTLVKYFKITERVKFELRIEFYNLPNAFMPSDPDLGIASGTNGTQHLGSGWELRPRNSVHGPYPLLGSRTNSHDPFGGLVAVGNALMKSLGQFLRRGVAPGRDHGAV